MSSVSSKRVSHDVDGIKTGRCALYTTKEKDIELVRQAGEG